MKKLFAIALTLLMLVSAASPLCLAQGGKTVMVVLGDSIAEGIGAIPVTSSYSYTVAESRGYELYNYGTSGMQSRQLIREITYDYEVRDSISEADIIEISIGGNDFLLNNLFGLAWNCIWGDYGDAYEIIDSFRDNYEVIIGTVRELNPDAQIIAQTLYNPIWWFPVLGGAYENVLAVLNEVYYTYTETDANYCVIDVHGAFDRRIGLINFDFIHPSPFGHRVIARLLNQKLDELKI